MFLQVIVCTDGLANKGVGNLDGRKFICPKPYKISMLMVHFCFVFTDLRTPEAYVDAQAFYNELGTLAHQNWYECSLRSLSLIM